MELIKRPRRTYRRFETDPATQLSYHRRMSIFWISNFPFMNFIVGFDVWASLTGHDKTALLMTAVLLAINTNYSLYANLATEIGDAHGAYASLRTDQLQQEQEIVPEQPGHGLTLEALENTPLFALD